MESISIIYIVLIIQILTLIAVASLIYYFDDALRRFSTYCWNKPYIPFSIPNMTGG